MWERKRERKGKKEGGYFELEGKKERDYGKRWELVWKCTVVYSVHKKKKLFWRLQRTTRQVPPVEEQTRTEDPKVGGKMCPSLGKSPQNSIQKRRNRSTESVLGTFGGATYFPFVPILRCMGVYGVLVGPPDTAWRCLLSW